MAIDAKQLTQKMRPYEDIRPWRGLWKTAVLAAIVVPCAAFGLLHSNLWIATAASVCGAFFYTTWLITTHDAGHHTLTGWRWFDELVPRLISYPIGWAHGVYTEIHKLHHRMNGQDLRDPERMQYTEAEFNKASAPRRFYIRHQWLINIFVFAGVGYLFRNLSEAFQHLNSSKSLRRALIVDTICILSAMAGLLFAFGWRFVIIYFIFERITGALLQFRAHIEHYGLWGKGQHFFDTQMHNSRNIVTTGVVSWFFNHLNYHSVHHAFPRIPFYNLAAAHKVLSGMAEKDGRMLPQQLGYWQTGWTLARHPQVIPTSQEAPSAPPQKLDQTS